MPWIKAEVSVYWILFVGMFMAIAVWESCCPRAVLQWPTGRRWSFHALILLCCDIVQNFVLRGSPVLVAIAVSGSPYGALNRPWMPFALRCAATLLALDLVRYLAHRAFHSVPWLWRIHEVHHSDPDYDVSTAGRFHPLEALLAQAVYLAAVALLAPPVVAVFVAEMLGTAANLFEHANASLPGRAERAISRVIITPDLHRIHHSEEPEAQAQNFGQLFSCWDRLFGTYRGSGKDSATTGAAGIQGLRNETSLGIPFMLLHPFRRKARNQA